MSWEFPVFVMSTDRPIRFPHKVEAGKSDQSESNASLDFYHGEEGDFI